MAVGRVLRAAEPIAEPDARPAHRAADDELRRAHEAVAVVAAYLDDRAEQLGGVAADVLEAQAMMVRDEALDAEITARTADGLSAERAVFEACGHLRERLEAIGGYFADRAGDLDDLSQRLIAELLGVPLPGIPRSDEPYVLVARDLSPADTADLDLDRVLAFVTSEGGPTSHTAILARGKGLVAVVGCRDAGELDDGETVVVDAAEGLVVRDPDRDTLQAASRRAERLQNARAAASGPGRLADGAPLPLLANLGSSEAAVSAAAAGAEGVGLFRTEFLFLDRLEAPAIAEQRAHYTRLLSAFPGRKVVVRVLDAGADKPLPFLNDAHEENPALGVRGLRALRLREDVLVDQLTALAAAGRDSDADLQVMAPMVATAAEAAYFAGMAHERGLPVAGVMIEVPSAALIADHILRECDFVSIGTNDLTQYTLAADRLLGAVADLQSPWHPAVLRLVAEVGAAGRRAGKPVGVCGEAAADPLLAVVLAGLGVGTLSMAPAALADVRASLRLNTLDDSRRLAELALAADSADSARDAVRTAVRSRRP
jgi:phosphotransferase system enzyme I (PtsI)